MKKYILSILILVSFRYTQPFGFSDVTNHVTSLKNKISHALYFTASQITKVEVMNFSGKGI